ncbi:MAG: inner membrane CreD family protein [bacterium]|nr:inner membrane CreD family protein [bacterium]
MEALHLNRNYHQMWTDAEQDLTSSSFGVRLFKPADGYQRTMRTVKYAIMFIFLTFLTFFIIEVLNGRAVHPIQYALVGSALIVFHVLLLSLSEHISFNVSYITASVAVIVMIALYTRSVLGSGRLALVVAGMVTLLYGFLFVVLQAEDYALLLGSLGLFGILGLTMYLTRRIDWFTGLGPSPDAEAVKV